MILFASASTFTSCSTSPEEDGKKGAELYFKYREARENYGPDSPEKEAAKKEWDEFTDKMRDKYSDDKEGQEKMDEAYREAKAEYLRSKRAAE